MLISRHDRSYIVELEDGTKWRIWPADIATTLQWLPTTQPEVVAAGHGSEADGPAELDIHLQMHVLICTQIPIR